MTKIKISDFLISILIKNRIINNIRIKKITGYLKLQGINSWLSFIDFWVFIVDGLHLAYISAKIFELKIIY